MSRLDPALSLALTRTRGHVLFAILVTTSACAGGDDGDTGTTAASATATTTASTTAPTTTATSADTTTTGDPTETGTSAGTATAGTTSTSGPTSGPTTDPTATSDPTTGGTTGGGNDGTLCASQSEGRFFPAGSWFYQDASNMPVTADSAAITAWMESQSPPNGWGTGTMRIDFSIAMMDAPAGTAKRAYTPEPDYYYIPDCDLAPVPIPAGGYIEDYPQDPYDPNMPYAGYECSGYGDGADCHLIVLSRSEQRLYEIYHSTIDTNDDFYGGCLALWDTSKAADADGRGQQCTSADAAGFPIAPLLFTADEIAAGEIDHAIRFILPNSMIRAKKYVAPATHGTNTSGPATSIPYGGHMRLRADYPIETLSPAAQVVAKALQKYGMYMSDGGNIALTAAADATGCHTWEEVGLGPQDLAALKATDFEVIDHGPTMDVTYDCQRQQILE